MATAFAWRTRTISWPLQLLTPRMDGLILTFATEGGESDRDTSQQRWLRMSARGQQIASGGRVVTGAVALAFGITAVGIYAAQGPSSWTVFASALMLAGAAILLGGTLGFLFGVPRTLSGDAPQLDATLASSGATSPRYGANTNLEQISDWLTKILVGIGIAQFGAIRAAAGRLFTTLAPSLGNQPSSATFAGALIVYFGLIGFLAGWLLTRLFLAPALSVADRRVLQKIVAADQAAAEGDTEKAAELRQEALDLLQRAAPTAAAYEQLRTGSPPSDARTMEMEALVAKTRANAEQESLRREDVRRLFNQGNDGERIYALALMEGNPQLANLEAVLDAIEDPRSAFEQYHALRVARLLLPTLDDVQGGRLATAVKQQQDNGRVKPDDGGRWKQSEAILKALAERG